MFNRKGKIINSLLMARNYFKLIKKSIVINDTRKQIFKTSSFTQKKIPYHECENSRQHTIF